MVMFLKLMILIMKLVIEKFKNFHIVKIIYYYNSCNCHNNDNDNNDNEDYLLIGRTACRFHLNNCHFYLVNLI